MRNLINQDTLFLMFQCIKIPKDKTEKIYVRARAFTCFLIKIFYITYKLKIKIIFQILFPLLTIIPPTIIGLCTEDVEKLVTYTGTAIIARALKRYCHHSTCIVKVLPS